MRVMNISSPKIKKEKILYIHGLGSDSNSGTGIFIKELLKDDYEVIIPFWDLVSNPFDTINAINKFILENDISLVIASSLGAFFALNQNPEIRRILINPCLEPSVQIPKLIELKESQINSFKRIESKMVENIDLPSNPNIFGGFGDKDELFNYQDLFRKRYGNNMIIVDGSHKLPDDSLEEVIKKGLSYFFNTPADINIRV